MANPEPVYLLLGPEEGEKSRFLDQLLNQLTEHDEKPEVHRVYPFDANLVDVVARMRTGTLFAARQVVIIDNVEQVKNRNDTALLAEYCADPAPATTLVLVSAQVGGVSSRIEKAIPKKNRRVFWELFENRKQDWIRRYFRERDIRIEQDALELILDLQVNNTRALEETCGRLALFFGAGALLERDTLEGYLYHDKHETVFSLFDRLAERDLEGSLDILEKILLSRESTPVGILAGLLWQLRNAATLSQMVSGGSAPDRAFSRLNIRGKRAQRSYQKALRNYTPEELLDAIGLLEQTDRRLRSGGQEFHRIHMHQFFCSAMRRQSAA